MNDDKLRVGVITSPHGVKGEVNVFPTTDDLKRFDDLKSVYIDLGSEQVKTGVESVKYFKNTVILKLSYIGDRDMAEKMREKDLLVDRSDAVPLEEGEYFICDLIGLNVIGDDGKHLGKIKDVLQTGANDVYLVERPDGKELLIPVTDECVKDISPDDGKVMVHLLPGLEEL
ncbi:MAG: ribosome maturation factor RimM [Lachnospiraceae bacterium]|nr:ribosome maturation factor RimM [Lachnospiraceae bacterium]